MTTQVRPILRCLFITLIYHPVEYKEAFALFDKKGTGAVPRETLGDLLRALGQNPTQAEVADIVAGAPREGKCVLASCSSHLTFFAVDYKTFLTILNRSDGFKPAGTPGKCSSFRVNRTALNFPWQRSSSVDFRFSIKRATDSLGLGSYGTC